MQILPFLHEILNEDGNVDLEMISTPDNPETSQLKHMEDNLERVGRFHPCVLWMTAPLCFIASI